MMKKMMLILLVTLIFASCSVKDKEVKLIELPVEVDDKLVDENLRRGISKYLEERGYKGDIEETLECEWIRLNSDEIPNEIAGIILIRLVYAGLDGIILVDEEDNIISMMSGMGSGRIFVTDLDQNKENEILYQTSMGSGMVRVLFNLYDATQNKTFSYSYYDDNNEGELRKENDSVMVHSLYRSFDGVSSKPYGTLRYDSDELWVEEERK